MIGVSQVWSQPTPQLASEEAKSLAAKLLALPTSQPEDASILLSDNRKSITKELVSYLLDIAFSIPSRDERSLAINKIALEAARLLGNSELEGLAWHRIGWVMMDKGEFDLANKAFISALHIWEQIGSTYDVVLVLGDLGALCTYKGEYQQAKEHSVRCLEVAETLPEGKKDTVILIQIALAWNNIGMFYRWRGDYPKAVHYLKLALAQYEKLQVEDSIAYVLANLGRVHRDTGDYIQSLNYFNDALKITTKMARNQRRTAEILNAIGLLFAEQRDNSKALEYLNKSLEVFSNTNDNIKKSQINLNLGMVYTRQNKLEDASRHLLESLKLSEAAKYEDGILAAERGLGFVSWKQGDYQGSIDHLNKSWLKSLELKDEIRQAEILWSKAEVYCAQKNYATAIECAQRALSISEKFGLFNLFYLSAVVLGKCYFAQDNIGQSFSILSQAIKKIEEVRYQVAGVEQERVAFFEDKVEAYQAMAEVLLSQKRVMEALTYSEQAKSRALLDIVQNGQVAGGKMMSSNEREAEQKLKSEIYLLNSQLMIERRKTLPDRNSEISLIDRLKDARFNYDTFRTNLYASHPWLRLRRVDFPSLSQEMCDFLLQDPHTALLEFLIAGDKVYLFLVTRNASPDGKNSAADVKVYPLALSSSKLREEIKIYYKQLSGQRIDFKARARELYNVLLKDAEPQLAGRTKLCIVPDGFLWELPFQTLIDADDKFLLEKYAIFNSPSLVYLYQVKRNDQLNHKKADKAILAVGNPTLGQEIFERYPAIKPLPDAEAEVGSISDIYGQGQSMMFTGASATEGTIKSKIRTAKILHFATHGVIDRFDAFHSHLILAKDNRDPAQDGLLDVSEIAELNLNANMAILSACETGGGSIGNGEGVISMAWAFLVAGTPTTIVSQWRVDSASTSELMVEFHRQLIKYNRGDARTAGKVEALRDASLKLMQNKQYRHPFFWAGFIALGSDQ
jgi:CHAT domain-containing protein/Flp pilus assembly protein TadD